MTRIGSGRTHGLRRAWVALAAAVVVTGSMAGGTAMAGPPGSTKLVITAVTDQGTGLPVPIAGEPFSVDVQLRNADDEPVKAKKKVLVELDVSAGMLSGTTTGIIPKGEKGTTISGVVYPDAANVTLFASGTFLGWWGSIETGEWFLTVQKTAVPIEASQNAFTLSTCGPGDPSPANPKCIVAEFRNGAPSGYTSHGSCLDYPGVIEGTCPAGAADVSMISLISDLSGLYTRTDPLKVSWFCDESACPRGRGGPTSGNPFTTLFVETENGFVASPSCPAKGVIGPDQKFCTDYVQSTGRPGGDLKLVILFDGDPRWM